MKVVWKRLLVFLFAGLVVTVGSLLLPAAAQAQECIPAPDGLVAWWPGDGDYEDIAGGRNGTPIGTVGFAPGMVDDAFDFSGTNAYLSVADDPIWTLGSDPFTIDLWVNFSSIQGRDSFMGHDVGGGTQNKWIFWYDQFGHNPAPSGPALRFHINGPDLPAPAAKDPIFFLPWNPNIGQWYHVAVTRNGNTYALYIDGAQVTTSVDANPIPDPSVVLTIGSAQGFRFDGLIDEVEVFDRALDASEIQALYDAGSAGKCKPGAVPMATDTALTTLGLVLLAALTMLASGCFRRISRA